MVQALELLYALGGKKHDAQQGDQWEAVFQLQFWSDHDSVLTSVSKLSYPEQEAASLLSVCVLAGLDQYGRLTDPMGMRMAEFPLSPMFAKMLLESGTFGCSKEIVTIAAMMQIQNIFVVPPNQKKVAVSENVFFKEAAWWVFGRNG